jgi:hypothetical protein
VRDPVAACHGHGDSDASERRTRDRPADRSAPMCVSMKLVDLGDGSVEAPSSGHASDEDPT